MLSIVIITKNEDRNIQRTIDSCLKVSPSEIIIVDSNSDDKTTEIVSENIKNNKTIKLITYRTPPFTAARGRHIGAQNISPECTHILFLDGDMEIESDFISEGIRTLRSDSALAIVMGQMSNYYYDDNHKLIKIETNVYDLRKHTIGGAMLMLRKTYDESGGFNVNLIANEESEIEYRLNKLGYFSKRIQTPMIRHHTEAPGSRSQLRTRILNKRITAIGVNLYYCFGDFGYFKRFFTVNEETFVSLMFLALVGMAMALGYYGVFVMLSVIYAIYIKIKTGRLRPSINYCVYAVGMMVGLLMFLAKKKSL